MILEDEVQRFVESWGPPYGSHQRRHFIDDLRQLMNRYAEGAIQHGNIPEVGAPHGALATTKIGTLEDAASFISIQSGGLAPPSAIVDYPVTYRATYREAAVRLHPDGAAPNPHLWHLLGEAKELLDQHHGLKTGGTA